MCKREKGGYFLYSIWPISNKKWGLLKEHKTMLMKDKENLEIPFMNGNLAYDKGDISETWRMGWLVEYWEKVSLGKEE